MSLIPSIDPPKRKKLLYGLLAFVLLFLVGLSVFAKNGWLPGTDPLSGKKTGWFGKELPKNASSSWNPLDRFSPSYGAVPMIPLPIRDQK